MNTSSKLLLLVLQPPIHPPVIPSLARAAAAGAGTLPHTHTHPTHRQREKQAARVIQWLRSARAQQQQPTASCVPPHARTHVHHTHQPNPPKKVEVGFQL